MRVNLNPFFLLVMSLCITSCEINKDANSNMEGKTIMEVTTFSINSNVNPIAFAKRDAQVQSDFTGKQKGFLQRLTGVDEAGKQVVAVYWASKSTSDAALKPFMEAPISKEFMQEMDQASVVMGRYSYLSKS